MKHPSKQEVNAACLIVYNGSMVPRPSVQELVKLRVSVARIAQVVGVSLTLVGLPNGAPYEAIVQAAKIRQRGWNVLCARIVGMVQQDYMARFETK